jgi:hypothetical protein
LAGACTSSPRALPAPNHFSYLARQKTTALFIALDRHRSILTGTMTIATLVGDGTRVKTSTSPVNGTFGRSGSLLVASGKGSISSIRATSQKADLVASFVAHSGDPVARVTFKPATPADYRHALKLLNATAAQGRGAAKFALERNVKAVTDALSGLRADASALKNSATGIGTGSSNLENDLALIRQDAAKVLPSSAPGNPSSACTAVGTVRDDFQSVSDDAQFVEGFITGLRSNVATVHQDQSKLTSAEQRLPRVKSTQTSSTSVEVAKALADSNASIALAHADATGAVQEANRTVASARSVADQVVARLHCGSAIAPVTPLPQPDF